MLNNRLCDCAPDAEWHQFDRWGETDDGSLEGTDDADAY